MSDLQVVNKWLVDNAVALKLPTFRQEISRSGQNYDWLRKAVRKGHIEAPDHIKEIIGKDFKELLN